MFIMISVIFYQNTKLLKLIHVILLTNLFYFNFAFSGAKLTEAENSLSNASNRYFDALFEGGPKSHKEVLQIREQTITPAMDKVMQVLERDNQNFTKNNVSLMPQEQFRSEIQKAESSILNWPQKNEPVKHFVDFAQKYFGSGFSDHALAGLPGSENLPPAQDATGARAGRKAASVPQNSIDGSKVPKVLVFPGPQKKKEESLEDFLK